METQAHVPGEVKTLPAEHKGTVAGAKPHLSFWQIWNMCFGFLGLQFGFALQNANVSRIFQTLGASLEQIPLLWVAAPFTGLVVQPLIAISPTAPGRGSAAAGLTLWPEQCLLRPPWC